MTLNRNYTKQAQPTEAQKAAMLMTLREQKAAMQRELGLGGQFGAASPATSATPAPRAPTPANTGGIGVLRTSSNSLQRPTPQPQSQQGSAWGGAGVGANVEDRLRADMNSIIPGAVFVEKVRCGWVVKEMETGMPPHAGCCCSFLWAGLLRVMHGVTCTRYHVSPMYCQHCCMSIPLPAVPLLPAAIIRVSLKPLCACMLHGSLQKVKKKKGKQGKQGKQEQVELQGSSAQRSSADALTRESSGETGFSFTFDLFS